MASEVLRFRCFQCNKLLGVSRSKAGRVVACPACSVELIVPEPEPLSNFDPSQVRIETETPSSSSVASATAPVSVEMPEDPPTSIMTEPTPSRPVFPLEPDTKVEPTSDMPVFSLFAGDAKKTDELPLPAFEAEQDSVLREREPRPRGRDVVLPRGVVAAWSLLVLLAVISAFAAGLLVGHFVWKA